MTYVDTLADLPMALRGRMLLPGDDGYPDAVAGFNLAVTHRAPVVVAARCAEDVAAAVRYASGAGLPVAVQATGHGAHQSFERCMLINTSGMDTFAIDPGARTATVGAGVKWRAVLDAAAEHGLAGLCGSTSDVGVVGFTVGGGLPVLGRAFGFAAERVHSLQVVTADGVIRYVDAEHEPELFWALRGGGGNAGIVTSMTFELLPLARVYGGGIFFRGEDAATVMAAYAEWVRTVPDELCSSLAFLRLPPFPEIPAPLRGQFTMHLRICYPGDPAEGERLVEPMRSCAPAVIEMLHELPYQELDLIHQDPDHPVPFTETGGLLAELDRATIDTLVAQAGPQSQCPLLLVEVRHLGAALARQPKLEDAVGAREAAFSLTAVGMLAGPAAGAVQPALAGLSAALAPHTTGRTFVNLHGHPGDEPDRARAWAPEQYARLRRVKGRYDPGNTFRFGHAISPAS